jgi:hypothetical protein
MIGAIHARRLAPLSNRPIRRRKTMREGDHAADDVLSDGFRIGVGREGDGNAKLRAGVDRNVIQADPMAGDNPKPLTLL